ncbi:MAG: T9SS C-terminal target domain-containing protein [Saprospirales bacterium]|nr:MAG: T9SS C-terminal target domain-containing protein [Saprospirales bacterium]
MNTLISIAANDELPSKVYARAILTKLDPTFGPVLPPDLGLGPCPYVQQNREADPEVIEEAENQWNGFSLSPVPASNEVVVSWESDVVVKGYQIYDIRGQLVHKVDEPIVSESNVDVSHLSSGMYIFTLILEDGNIDTQKLLIQ